MSERTQEGILFTFVSAMDLQKMIVEERDHAQLWRSQNRANMNPTITMVNEEIPKMKGRGDLYFVNFLLDQQAHHKTKQVPAQSR